MLMSRGPSVARSRKRRRASPTPSPSYSSRPPTTVSTGWRRSSISEAPPKLPPPPRRPQRSSASSSSEACTFSPDAVTSVAPTSPSQVRPNWAVRWPMPPPSVSPVTPVEPTTPPGVARPCCWTAASKSSQVAPPPDRAMRVSGSTSTFRIRERSITSPSSTEQWPAGLWPPPRTAISSPFACPKARALATSSASTQRAIAAGLRTISRLKQSRARSYSRSPSTRTSPVSASRSSSTSGAISKPPVEDLDRAAGQRPLAGQHESLVGLDRGRELHALAGEDRQDDQAELVDRAQLPVGLDRGGSADQVDVAALVRLAHELQQPLRVALHQHVVRGAVRAFGGQDEHVDAGPGPLVGDLDRRHQRRAAHQHRVGAVLELDEPIGLRIELRVRELDGQAVGIRDVAVETDAHARADPHLTSTLQGFGE